MPPEDRGVKQPLFLQIKPVQGDKLLHGQCAGALGGLWKPGEKKPGIPHGEDTGFPLRIRMIQKVRLPAVSRSFCRKRSAHIRTGASSLRNSPGNGGYAWHPPYSGFVPYLSPSIETGSPGKGAACQSSCYLLSFCFRLCRYRTVSVPARTRAPARCRGKEGWVHHPQS